MTTNLITSTQRKQLLKNGTEIKNNPNLNLSPVVKLFTPDAGCTWLLASIDPDRPDIAFGLCDLGMEFPELGDVSLNDIAKIRGGSGLPVEQDKFWKPKGTIGEYYAAARRKRRIVQL